MYLDNMTVAFIKLTMLIHPPWLYSWCLQQGFGFYVHGPPFEDQELLGQSRSHLTTWGKMICAKRLPSLVRRALN